MEVNSMNPRKPTEAEKNELVEYLLANDYENDQNERMNIHGFVEQAAIAVFDDYITGSPGYSGKLMVVVYDGDPKWTETYTWERESWIDDKEEKKLHRVVAIQQ